YLAVAYTQEGITLREAGISLPILVLHPQTSNLKKVIEYCLEPNIYNKKVLKEFILVSKSENQKNYPVHLKFNTGLNRLGFGIDDQDFVIEAIQKTQFLKIKSVFSHLAASEDLNEKAFTLNQIEEFRLISKNILSNLDYKPLLHICNTSGILNFPEAHFDMVRSGIGVYGFGNSIEEQKNLIPIASLKTVISQIHNLKVGESVGYNRAYKSNGVNRIATLPIGHADGISRIYGNSKGYVVINNQKAPVVGNVCMDMVMVDITNIECKEGDEVIVFNDVFTAEELAESAATISYELITSISQRVKRKIVE
ncbi:MAG: alanine racemase, partial [Bacteroidia bacterium]|nr:alanine racemase [Bacteroidia bacterium]